jgi:hypothetical protein
VESTDILRGHSIPDPSDVVRALGGENVFISVHKSDIWDDSQGAFMEPDLVPVNYGVERSLELLTTTCLDETTVLDDAPRCVG